MARATVFKRNGGGSREADQAPLTNISETWRLTWSLLFSKKCLQPACRASIAPHYAPFYMCRVMPSPHSSPSGALLVVRPHGILSSISASEPSGLLSADRTTHDCGHSGPAQCACVSGCGVQLALPSSFRWQAGSPSLACEPGPGPHCVRLHRSARLFAADVCCCTAGSSEMGLCFYLAFGILIQCMFGLGVVS